MLDMVTITERLRLQLSCYKIIKHKRSTALVRFISAAVCVIYMLADTWNLDCKLLFFAEDRNRDFDVSRSLGWYICTAWLCNTHMSIKQRLWGSRVIIWHYYCSFCISGHVFSKINAIIHFCYKAFNVKRLILASILIKREQNHHQTLQIITSMSVNPVLSCDFSNEDKTFTKHTLSFSWALSPSRSYFGNFSICFCDLTSLVLFVRCKALIKAQLSGTIIKHKESRLWRRKGGGK